MNAFNPPFKTSLQQLSSVCKLKEILYRLYCNYYHCWWLIRQFWHSNNILCPIEIQSNFIRFIFIPRLSCNMTTHSHEMSPGLWQSVASLCPCLLLSSFVLMISFAPLNPESKFIITLIYQQRVRVNVQNSPPQWFLTSNTI